MQKNSAKRPFKLMLEQNDLPISDELFPCPEKRVKKRLSIEILDSFADASNKTPKGYLISQRAPSLPLMSPKSCASPRFLLSNVCKDQSLSNFLPMNNSEPLSTTPSHEYDDFYLEGSFYDVTMRKCHRKIMEDRVKIYYCIIIDKSPQTVTESELHKDKFFAIYDGHSSTFVSDYLQQNFHKAVAENPNFADDPRTALKEGMIILL